MHELENGYMCFDKLWNLLDKKGMNKQRLKENGLHSNTVAKLAKNENVTTDVLCKLCKILKCQPSQIMEYKEYDAPTNTQE